MFSTTGRHEEDAFHQQTETRRRFEDSFKVRLLFHMFARSHFLHEVTTETENKRRNIRL